MPEPAPVISATLLARRTFLYAWVALGLPPSPLAPLVVPSPRFRGGRKQSDISDPFEIAPAFPIRHSVVEAFLFLAEEVAVVLLDVPPEGIRNKLR